MILLQILLHFTTITKVNLTLKSVFSTKGSPMCDYYGSGYHCNTNYELELCVDRGSYWEYSQWTCFYGCYYADCVPQCEIGDYSFCRFRSNGNYYCCGNNRVLCSNGRISGGQYCGSGCYSGHSGSSCDPCNIGASCSGWGDFCCKSNARAHCNGAQVDAYYGSCSNGCWGGSCVSGPCEVNALCSSDKCCGESIHGDCQSGRIQTKNMCEFGCYNNGCVGSECDIGALCTSNSTHDMSCCEPDLSVHCDTDIGRIDMNEICIDEDGMQIGCNIYANSTCNEAMCMYNSKDDIGCTTNMCCRDYNFDVYRIIGSCDGDNRVQDSEECSFGCDNGVCLNIGDCNVGNTCPYSNDDYCCGNELLNTCIDNNVSQSVLCEYGCSMYDKRCYNPFEIGAHCEENTTCHDTYWLVECDMGWERVDTAVNCSYGCSQTDLRCYFANELGALCEDNFCDIETLVSCNSSTNIVDGTSPCIYGCKSNEKRCFNKLEIGAICTDDECIGDWLLDCTSSRVSSYGNCSHGCKASDNRCYDSHEMDAYCYNHAGYYCENSDWFVDCSSGQITHSENCAYGCNHDMNRCYNENEVDSKCNNDFCTAQEMLGQCVNGRVSSDFANCSSYGCDSSYNHCFDENDVGSKCEASKCITSYYNTHVECVNGRVVGTIDCLGFNVCNQEEGCVTGGMEVITTFLFFGVMLIISCIIIAGIIGFVVICVYIQNMSGIRDDGRYSGGRKTSTRNADDFLGRLALACLCSCLLNAFL